ncbi:MAG: hypothetical protein Q7T71_12555 [Herbiconiux sp.]|nr:hypothetical protein [Herbiconiux sp.]
MSEMDDFEGVAIGLLSDADRDVVRDGDELLVHGIVFARLEGEALLVRLPGERASDLVERGVATPAEGGAGAGAADEGVQWVGVADREDWAELAGEAHTLAHGHVPGGQS